MKLLGELALGLGTSFAGSLMGFVVAFHYDLEGKWEQVHLRRAARHEAVRRAREGLPEEPR